MAKVRGRWWPFDQKLNLIDQPLSIFGRSRGSITSLYGPLAHFYDGRPHLSRHHYTTYVESPQEQSQ